MLCDRMIGDEEFRSLEAISFFQISPRTKTLKWDVVLAVVLSLLSGRTKT